MAILSAKVLGVVVAGALGVSAVTYSGGAVINNIKANIQALEDKAELYHDEAYSKGVYANKMLESKNSYISDLEAEIDRLETEVQEQKTIGDTEVTAANGEINEANEDMTELNTVSNASVGTVNNLANLGGVTDNSQRKVVGEKLTVAVVQSQSERTIKLGNPNTVGVEVSYNGNVVSVPAGDVVYVKVPNAAKFTYTVPGTNEVVNNTK